MKKISLLVLGLILIFAPASYALIWTPSPDANVSGSPETTLTIGVSDVGLDEWDTASAGIFGVGANLGNGFTSHTVTSAAALYSWDSYNDTWGYGDVFLIALTEGDYYWNLPITHPVDSDSQLIWPLPDISAWGGDEWGDEVLDSLIDPGSLFTFNVDPSKDYYLNLILDTSNGGDMFPSWGDISQFQIQSTAASDVPEPSALLLLGSGLAGLGFWKRKGFHE